MSIVLDLIVIGIILIFTFIGYKHISNLIIKNTLIDENIKGTIVNKIGNNNSEKQEVKIEDTLTSKIVGKATATIEELATSFSIKIIEIITLIIIFILLKIILKIVAALTDLIAKIPIIKQMNKLRGNNIRIYKRLICSLYNISCNIFNISINE